MSIASPYTCFTRTHPGKEAEYTTRRAINCLIKQGYAVIPNGLDNAALMDCVAREGIQLAQRTHRAGEV